MQIVIDIPEKVHNRIRSRYGHCGAIKNGIWSDDLTTVSKAIWNGTPYEERKMGKWVLTHPLQEDDGGAYVCSCCKSGSYEVIPKTWKACPLCTALMEVDE